MVWYAPYVPVLFVNVTLYSVCVYGRRTLCYGGLPMSLHRYNSTLNSSYFVHRLFLLIGPKHINLLPETNKPRTKCVLALWPIAMMYTLHIGDIKEKYTLHPCYVLHVFAHRMCPHFKCDDEIVLSLIYTGKLFTLVSSFQMWCYVMVCVREDTLNCSVHAVLKCT